MASLVVRIGFKKKLSIENQKEGENMSPFAGGGALVRGAEGPRASVLDAPASQVLCLLATLPPCCLLFQPAPLCDARTLWLLGPAVQSSRAALPPSLSFLFFTLLKGRQAVAVTIAAGAEGFYPTTDLLVCIEKPLDRSLCSWGSCD
jgi:hypothetical protein